MFQKNDRVRVEYVGTFVGDSACEWVVKDDDESYHYYSKGVVVLSHAKPEKPKDWPPQVGDIWEANGREYIVVSASNVISSLFIGCIDDPDYDLDGDNLEDDFMVLNPLLVRRRRLLY